MLGVKKKIQANESQLSPPYNPSQRLPMGKARAGGLKPLLFYAFTVWEGETERPGLRSFELKAYNPLPFS
jgi:hypothetical protein